MRVKGVLLFLCLVVAVAYGSDFLTYDPARRVVYFNDGQYTRDEYHWFAKNTGELSMLFQNGNFVSEEGGTNDIRLAEARALQPNATNVLVGVVDTDGGHGQRVKAVVDLVGGLDSILSHDTYLSYNDVAASISNFVSAGFQIVIVTILTGNHPWVSNACRYAEASGAFVVCSVPNVAYSIDAFPDYPPSYCTDNPAVFAIASTARNGQLLAGGTAWGTNTLAAPGRNIVVVTPANGTNYSSGTSYAAPLFAGCLALLLDRYPGQSLLAYRQAAFAAASPIINSRRIDAVDLLNAPQCVLSITPAGVTVHGLSEWQYAIEHSYDLQNWTHYADALGGQTIAAQPGFYRANCGVSFATQFVVQRSSAVEAKALPQPQMKRATLKPDKQVLRDKITRLKQ